jgi:outer membrane protein assembly factor BamB
MKRLFKKNTNTVFECVIVAFLLLILMTSITIVQAQTQPFWPCWRHDILHTGRTHSAGTNTGRVKWTYPAGPTTVHDITTSPALDPNGTIYIGSSDGKLYALNPDGEVNENWPVEIRHIKSDPDYFAPILHSSPAIDPNGAIYIGSSDGNIYAFFPDGRKKWRLYPPDVAWDTNSQGIWSSPAIQNGVLYIGSYDGKVYAIDTDTKEIIWESADPNWGPFLSSPAVGRDGTIYIGSNDFHLYAFDPNGTDGSYKWRFRTKASVASSPAIGNCEEEEKIYVGSYDHCVYALYKDGNQAWKFSTDGPIYSSPAIGYDETIYVGSYDHCLYAINPDGTLKWKYETGAGITSSPAVGYGDPPFTPSLGEDGTVYVGSNDGNLYALDHENGDVKWMSDANDVLIDPNDIEGSFSSSPAIWVDGTIYIGNLNGRLYAFGNESGNNEVFCYLDNDQDSYGNPNTFFPSYSSICPWPYVKNSGDCDDDNNSVNPGVNELCDEKDNNCNGVTNEGFNVGESCIKGIGECQGTGWMECSADGSQTQCNAIPGNPETEVCDNLDNNCDGVIDEEDAQGCIIYYKDKDNDGYGVDGDSKCLCSPDIQEKYTAIRLGDPDDLDPNIPETIHTKNMSLPAGWSMISLPLIPQGPQGNLVSYLFPGAKVVYGFDKGKGYIRIADEKVIKVGKGYWILMDEAKTHFITGSIISEHNFPVQEGWYMIGGCTLQANASVDSGNIRVIYGYEQGSGYERVLESEYLEPGKGYWIKFEDIAGQASLTVKGVME